jgi:hypothetical protein
MTKRGSPNFTPAVLLQTRSNMKKILMCFVFAASVWANTHAAPISFQSGETQVSLLELYTSEGCSSCPPAESWLARLKDSPDLWKKFAPMAFHVDYWDSSNWKDRWSSPEFTERQRAYADAWKSDEIYTPCFVLNGKEWHGWFMHQGIPGISDDEVGVLAVSSTDTNYWRATFIPAKPSSFGYEIHAALLAGGLNSDVTAGENGGRHLQHEFAVLNLVQIGMTTSNGVAKGRFILDTPQFGPEKIMAMTVWVTRVGELEPLQATGGWLISPADPAR